MMSATKIAQYTCRVILRNRSRSLQISAANFSSDVTAKRTSEQNPAFHTRDHIGLFYTIPPADSTKLFTYGGFPKPFKKNVITFAETSIMVREPALEIIDFLKTADYNRPAVRYILYGKKGCGKSVSLVNIVHYAYSSKYFLLHVPWVWDWFLHNRTEVASSPLSAGLFDLPVVSATWLKHFESQNSELLADENIKTSKDYVWNQRELTPAGSKLSDLVIHGINRIKYAAGCIDAIIDELKVLASQDKCKVLVALDGINCLFYEESNYKTQDRVRVKPEMVTLTHSFLKATTQDWKNAAVVVTVDQRAGREPELESHFPLYLLRRTGFEHLDPFISVSVPELTDLEFHSMLDYYEDRKWIQRKGARGELSFLSNNNPFQLMNLCNPL